MINFVCALPCEAKPLIAHYRLKRQPCSAFQLFTGDDIQLTVSGSGKLAAAAAAAYLHARTGDRPDQAWLNVGIAGHPELEIGSPALAHKITDVASEKSWYPSLVFTPPSVTAALQTVDNAEQVYQDEALFDMEAAGFYTSASRFSTSELIHCLKIVSDNRQHHSNRITSKLVEQLIECNMALICKLASTLDALASDMGALTILPAELPRYLERWHFSQYQQHRLAALLRRWHTLAPEHQHWPAQADTLKDGRAVIEHLEQTLAAIPVHFTPLPA